SSFVNMLQEALNRCLLGLSEASLKDPVRPRTARNPYDCGSVMQILLHRALRDQGLDLWRFWRALLEGTSSTSGYYTHADFFKLAERKIGGAPIVGRLRALSEGVVKGSSESPNFLENFFITTYESVGIGLSAIDNSWPEWYSRMVAER